MPTPIGREEVQRLLAAGAQIVDVLPRQEFEEQHIAGAIHISLMNLDAETAGQLRPDRPIVVYCNDLQ